MVTVQEFVGLLIRVGQSRSHKAGNVAPNLRDDFLPGYTNAVLDLGRRYGITWT
jgi:hypothetical protein